MKKLRCTIFHLCKKCRFEISWDIYIYILVVDSGRSINYCLAYNVYTCFAVQVFERPKFGSLWLCGICCQEFRPDSPQANLPVQFQTFAQKPLEVRRNFVDEANHEARTGKARMVVLGIFWCCCGWVWNPVFWLLLWFSRLSPFITIIAVKFVFWKWS